MVVVVEGKQWTYGGGAGGGREQWKCDGAGGGRGGGKENNIILWPEILCKCSTYFLFLSLHSDPEELI